VALGVVIAAGGAILAMGPASASDDDEYGAYIYTGTCDDFSGAAVEDVGDLEEDDADFWRVLGDDEPAPNTIYGEDEDITPSIDELTGEPHVLVVRAADDETADVVACGEISGTAGNVGSLTIELEEVEGSGVQGRASFGPDDDDDDDQIRVTTGVWLSTGGTPASPESTPAA
jgi:hypothetical protein